MKTLLFFFTISLLSTSIIFAWSYPVKTIYPKNCPIIENSDCGYDLPIIKDANYENHRYDRDIRKVYTMLQGTTYFDGRDIGIGSHQGIDIASSKGTHIYASATGKIILAEYKGGRGNVITIEHDHDGHKLYTTYAHLDTISVIVGQTVNEGDKIATMGDTGNSTGPHLHFQIEKEGEHPFFFKNCAGEIPEIVNEGRCQSQMYNNTLDPILFIEKKGNIPLERTIVSSSEKIMTKTQIDILYTGFIGGPLQTHETCTLILSSSELNIDSQIQITSSISSTNIFPSLIEVIDTKRKIFITPSTEGTGYIQISDGEKKLSIPFYATSKSFETQNIPHTIIDIDSQNKLLVIPTATIQGRKQNTQNTITLISNIYDKISYPRSKSETLKTRFYQKENYTQITSANTPNLNPKFLIYKIQKNSPSTSSLSLFQNDIFLGYIQLQK